MGSVSDQTELLLDFVRSAAHHSALKGDRLPALLDKAVDCLTQGTGASVVEFAATPLVGEDLLVAHEIDLVTAAAHSRLAAGQLSEGDKERVGIAWSSGQCTVVDVSGHLLLLLEGTEGPLAALRLLAPPHLDIAPFARGTAGFASAVTRELGSAVLRHWVERQHLDRSVALLEAQRHTHVGCFEWDIVADKVRWSDELFRIFGDEPQGFEPTFEEFLERIHVDDRDAVRASVYEAYEERRDYRIEERIIRPDGAVRQLASWGHVIVDDKTVPIKIIGSCQDVTDFRAAMQELAETERRLAEVQERKTRALELNDNVVQGLASGLFALELGMVEEATTAFKGTLQAARAIIGDLLMGSGQDIDALALTRTAAAHSFLPAAPPIPTTDRPAAAIRVVIADDSSDIRLLATKLLSGEPDFQVVAEAADGVEAVHQATVHQPDLVLLDLAMPVMDGLRALPEIRAVSPGSLVVVFSGFNAGAASEEAVRCGASAYIEKGLLSGSLAEALRQIHRRAGSEAGAAASL